QRKSNMNTEDVLLLGLKRSVLAVSKENGRILWATKLPAAMQEFVTVACDGQRVFAYSGGHLSALDLATGQLLWDNGLPGYGYGLGTICFPGNSSGPEIAAAAEHQAQAAAAASSSSAAAA